MLKDYRFIGNLVSVPPQSGRTSSRHMQHTYPSAHLHSLETTSLTQSLLLFGRDASAGIARTQTPHHLLL